MNGLEVEDRMTANGNLHSRVLQGVLRARLSELETPLYDTISKALASEMSSFGKEADDWVELRSFSTTKKIITAANSLVFFGQEVSKDPEFLHAALDYPEDLLKTGEILRFIPAFLAPILAPYLMRHHRASNVLVDRLTPVVESRLRMKSIYDECGAISPRPIDCIQFFIDANKKKGSRSAGKIVQVLLGVWFASVHQPALSLAYVLDDLCTHREYMPGVRDEILTCFSESGDIDSLPLLDGFLKESARLHPSDSISVRRKVLENYQLSDGTHLSRGDVVCVPLQAIMRDSNLYSDSLQFNPLRFSRDNDGLSRAEVFTDTNPDYPLWGLGKRGW